MYSTCLFCHAALGTNESIEHFPVGTRLAFDAKRGRLWVVCSKCARWNLSPLDERFEAIEEAERAYRDTKKRVATEQVGLARLRDGTDLIRIGEPLRPEFAAWRYGDTFGKRRRYRIALGAAGAIVSAGIVVPFTFDVPSFFTALAFLPLAALNLRSFRRLAGAGFTRVRIAANDGTIVKVSDAKLRFAMLRVNSAKSESASTLQLSVMADGARPTPTLHTKRADGSTISFRDPLERIQGQAAECAAAKILAATNALSGSVRDIARANDLVEQAPEPAMLLRSLPLDSYRPWLQRRLVKSETGVVSIASMPTYARLALEMSLHEDSERRALEGELHELEQRWKEAEEIAAISDSLFLARKGDAPSD